MTMILPPKHAERGALAKVWREFNKLRDCVAASMPVAGENVLVDRTTKGSIIRTKAESTVTTPSSPMQVGRFEIQSIDAAFLNCIYDGHASGFPTGNVVVAKPLSLALLAGTYGGVLYDGLGESYNARRATWVVGEHTLNWVEHIHPYYVAAGAATKWPLDFSHIYAANVGHDNIIGSGIPETDWVDMNVDGRNWFVDMNEYAVCVNGQVKYVALEGGLPPA